MLRVRAVVEQSHLPFDPGCPNQVLRLSPPVPIDTGPTNGARPPSRTYTVRRYDPESAQVDLDVVLHGDGPFVRWAESAKPGDTISFTGPRPHAVPSFDADAVVMASDETGLPALAALLEAAPAGLPVIACLEVADAAEEQEFATAAELTVHWRHRDGAPAGTTGVLGDALRSLDWPSGDVQLWVAGETSEVRAIRRFAASDRGVPRGSIHAYGYWRRGRADAEG